MASAAAAASAQRAPAGTPAGGVYTAVFDQLQRAQTLNDADLHANTTLLARWLQYLQLTAASSRQPLFDAASSARARCSLLGALFFRVVGLASDPATLQLATQLAATLAMAAHHEPSRTVLVALPALNRREMLLNDFTDAARIRRFSPLLLDAVLTLLRCFDALSFEDVDTQRLLFAIAFAATAAPVPPTTAANASPAPSQPPIDAAAIRLFGWTLARCAAVGCRPHVASTALVHSKWPAECVRRLFEGGDTAAALCSALPLNELSLAPLDAILPIFSVPSPPPTTPLAGVVVFNIPDATSAAVASYLQPASPQFRLLLKGLADPHPATVLRSVAVWSAAVRLAGTQLFNAAVQPLPAALLSVAEDPSEHGAAAAAATAPGDDSHALVERWQATFRAATGAAGLSTGVNGHAPLTPIARLVDVMAHLLITLSYSGYPAVRLAVMRAWRTLVETVVASLPWPLVGLDGDATGVLPAAALAMLHSLARPLDRWELPMSRGGPSASSSSATTAAGPAAPSHASVLAPDPDARVRYAAWGTWRYTARCLGSTLLFGNFSGLVDGVLPRILLLEPEPSAAQAPSLLSAAAASATEPPTAKRQRLHRGEGVSGGVLGGPIIVEDVVAWLLACLPPAPPPSPGPAAGPATAVGGSGGGSTPLRGAGVLTHVSPIPLGYFSSRQRSDPEDTVAYCVGHLPPRMTSVQLVARAGGRFSVIDSYLRCLGALLQRAPAQPSSQKHYGVGVERDAAEGTASSATLVLSAPAANLWRALICAIAHAVAATAAASNSAMSVSAAAASASAADPSEIAELMPAVTIVIEGFLQSSGPAWRTTLMATLLPPPASAASAASAPDVWEEDGGVASGSDDNDIVRLSSPAVRAFVVALAGRNTVAGNRGAVVATVVADEMTQEVLGDSGDEFL